MQRRLYGYRFATVLAFKPGLELFLDRLLPLPHLERTQADR
jgi:hypothetical protein